MQTTWPGATAAFWVTAAAATFGVASLGFVVSHLTWRGDVVAVERSSQASGPAVTDTGTQAPWPPLFGVAAPEDDTPSAPVEATQYTLSGLVVMASRSWAEVGDGTATVLVTVGDTLSGGEEVLRVDDDGVWITRGDGEALIGFERGAQSAPVASASLPDPVSAPMPEEQFEIPLKMFRETSTRDIIIRAGGVRVITLEDGTLAQEVLFVRPGQLYDRVGLRQNDTVLTINGIPAGDDGALRGAARTLLAEREFELVVIRSGELRKLRIKVNEDD